MENFSSYLFGFLGDLFGSVQPYLVPVLLFLTALWKRAYLARASAEIKFHFDSKIQDLKHKNTKKQLIHQLQFEKEFEAYRNMWNEVCLWRSVFRNFKFEIMCIDESQEGGTEKRIQIFRDSHKKFESLFEKMIQTKPFIPK